MNNLSIPLSIMPASVKSVDHASDEWFALVDDYAPPWLAVLYIWSVDYVSTHGATVEAPGKVGAIDAKAGIWPSCYNVVLRTSCVVAVSLMTLVASGYVDLELIN